MRYVYKARHVEHNQVIKGIGNYVNESELQQHLATMNMIPIRIKASSDYTEKKGKEELFSTAIKTLDLTLFCRQFAVIVGAGISVGRALELSAKECNNKNLRFKIEHIYEKVSRGQSLAQAIQESEVFPMVISSMIEAAEISGNLDQILGQIADYLESQLEIKNKIRKAMIYPSAIIITLIGAITLLITKVMPSYEAMFKQMEVELPKSTKIVMTVGQGMMEYGIFILLITGGMLLVINKLNMKNIGIKYRDRMVLNLPLIGALYKQLLTARWSKCMALLLNSGIPILQALEVSKKVLKNSIAEVELENMLETIRQGESLKEALKKSSIYPEFLASMVGVGEEVGSLEYMLVKVGDYFNDRLKESIDKMIIMIEPTLTIIIAVVVGFIMIAVLMPTFTLASSIL